MNIAALPQALKDLQYAQQTGKTPADIAITCSGPPPAGAAAVADAASVVLGCFTANG